MISIKKVIKITHFFQKYLLIITINLINNKINKLIGFKIFIIILQFNNIKNQNKYKTSIINFYNNPIT